MDSGYTSPRLQTTSANLLVVDGELNLENEEGLGKAQMLHKIQNKGKSIQ